MLKEVTTAVELELEPHDHVNDTQKGAALLILGGAGECSAGRYSRQRCVKRGASRRDTQAAKGGGRDWV